MKGVWVFHRHGDRTPARSLAAEHMYEAEATFWETKVPPIDRTYSSALSERFPVSFHESNDKGKFVDTEEPPYGFLTWKGMDQMRSIGETFARWYKPTNADWYGEWDLQCYSTNYLRTTLSLQCLLHGMLDSEKERNDFYQSTSSHPISFANILPDHIIKSAQGKERIPIQVRKKKADNLNSFDQNPEKMKNLVQSVAKTATFVEKDAEAGFLAARLANFLPGLSKIPSYGGLSGINWVHAADHFTCRAAHNIPFSLFIQVDEDPVVEQTLDAMWYPTMVHLAWRFRQFYQSPSLLAALAGSPLKEIQEEMTKILASPYTCDGRKPLRIYSCHDVTILGLLYAVNADFLASEKRTKDDGVYNTSNYNSSYWPEFASNLTFELVCTAEDRVNETYFVRIFLDGKLLRISNLNAPLLTVSMFSRLVDELLSHSIELDKCKDTND